MYLTATTVALCGLFISSKGSECGRTYFINLMPMRVPKLEPIAMNRNGYRYRLIENRLPSISKAYISSTLRQVKKILLQITMAAFFIG